MRLMDEVEENRLLGRWAALLPRAPRQIGRVHETDAELLPLDEERVLALTVDAVNEEVRAGLYRDPFTVGRTAAVAALSDLAAVGADPLGLLLAVDLPPGDGIQQRVAEGVAEACRQGGTWVLGGDTSDADRLSVTCTAAGLVPRAGLLTRVGARPGDFAFASGLLGTGSAFGAAALLGAPSLFPESDWRPRARLEVGRALRGIASACMDTSDGLLATLDQIARLNQIRLRVDQPLNRLIAPEANRVAQRLRLPAFALLAGHHGEYELVFTVPPERLSGLAAAAACLDWLPLPLGRVERGDDVYLGERRVDGAGLRNLWRQHSGDPAAYARALCEAAA